MANRIQFRRDTAANWASVNPILAQGELGIELTTNKLKIGNGITAWNSLPYFTLNYSDVTGAPVNLSDLTNDVGFITAADLPANELPVNAVGYLFNDGAGALSWDSVVGPTALSQLDNDTGFITAADVPAVPTATSDLTNDSGFITAADLPAPTDYTNFASDIIPDGNATRSLGSPTNQWKELYVSTGSIYIGNVKLSNTGGTLQINTIEKQIDPDTQEEVEVVLETESVQFTTTSNLQLTNNPIITQPVVLGAPVNISAAGQGVNAQVELVVDTGPVITSLNVLTPGTGYVVGQRYKIWYYLLTGGANDNSSVLFDVETVGANGELLTVTNVSFIGASTISPGTYTINPEFVSSRVFDAIDTGLTLTRDGIRALYNSDAEAGYDTNTYASPLGTAWNNDGWGDLTNLSARSYTTFRSALNNSVGNNILGAELVMHDTINDKYYTFSFSTWAGQNGAYAYTRRLVTDPNFFKKTNGGSEVDVIIPDDGNGAGVAITRGNNNGIYNPYREGSWDETLSPGGTLWNLDGWDDLSNVTTRTYTNFYAAYGNGGLGNKVPGSKAVMYVPDNGKYYAVQWLNWTQNNLGGGFSYTRKELDVTKLNEGVKFADGTVLKSAAGLGRVKSTATGGRRIEEAVGSNTVSVTPVVTTNITALASRSVVDDNRFWFTTADTIIDDIINNFAQYGVDSNTIEFSLDNVTWFPYSGGTWNEPTEIGLTTNSLHTYNQGDTIYIRYQSGGAPVVWWSSADLPGGSANFRGAIIDYHAYTGDATIIGTIYIADDDGDRNITHTEVASGGTGSENDDLWIVNNEGTISYRRIDGAARTLKVHWTAKVFYGTEIYD